MFRYLQGIPGRNRIIVWFCVMIGIHVSRHGSHILSHRNCRNMTFFVVTGVLILCCDDVATEVFLRDRDNQDKRLGVATEFGLGQGISCHDRVF